MASITDYCARVLAFMHDGCMLFFCRPSNSLAPIESLMNVTALRYIISKVAARSLNAALRKCKISYQDFCASLSDAHIDETKLEFTYKCMLNIQPSSVL